MTIFITAWLAMGFLSAIALLSVALGSDFKIMWLKFGLALIATILAGPIIPLALLLKPRKNDK